MNLTSDFQNLRVLINSTQDTTLVIRGPDGRYQCDDDGGERMNPAVTAAFGPGAYQVWVGMYAQGRTAPYVIGFSQNPTTTNSSLGL